MTDEPYCKVYLDAAMGLPALASKLGHLLGATPHLSFITGSALEVAVNRNDERDPQRADHSGEDGFLYYPWILDLSPAEGASETNYFAAVDQLLQALAQPGVRFVTAADDEPALWNGGRWDGRNPG